LEDKFPEDIKNSVKSVIENISDIEELFNYLDDDNDRKLYEEKYQSVINNWKFILE